MIEFIGFVGASLLIFSSIPQLIKTFKTKKVNDLSIYMLLSQTTGCLFMFLYILLTSKDMTLLVNYLFNTSVCATICYLYFKYRT